MRSWIVWIATAAVLIIVPWLFPQSFALTLLTQMCTFSITALSYNMLLGQGGMLSFGHAVYAGLGAYAAVHVLNAVGKGLFFIPVTLLPLVGGVAGIVFGVVFGYVTTKRAGTTFAMISLGIGELVFACVLMFPAIFGGEAGISTNRVVGKPFLGITYGPQIEVYYLVAAWFFIAMIAMYALTQTPLGRMANAVRDNPERAEFVGYDTQKVRFLQLVLSAFFAGISGALSCINFEIVTAENVSTMRSGAVLLATFIGGIPFFFGPVIGASIFILFVAALSGVTKAWLLYLGLIFVIMVLYAPGGIASIVVTQLRIIRAGQFGRLAGPYGLAASAGVVAFTGLVAMVEGVYHLSDTTLAPSMTLGGFELDAHSNTYWTTAVLALAAGLYVLRYASRIFETRWDSVQQGLKAASLTV